LPYWAIAFSESSKSFEKRKGKGKGKEKEPKRKITKEAIKSEPKRRRLTNYKQSVFYGEEEKHHIGESARIGIIQSALKQSKKSEPVVKYIKSNDNKYK